MSDKDAGTTTKVVSNFAFLQDKWTDLASLAGLAESYVYTEPASSLVKIRIFAETVVDILYPVEMQKKYGAIAKNVQKLRALQRESFRQSDLLFQGELNKTFKNVDNAIERTLEAV